MFIWTIGDAIQVILFVLFAACIAVFILRAWLNELLCKHDDGIRETGACDAICAKCGKNLGFIAAWRVALALQEAGWWLRQEIIWSKPNPMPESVLDRCTKAHEHIFLLAKSERYYFDAKAIAEPCVAGDNGSSYTSDYDKATKPGLGTGPRTPKGKAITSPRHDGNTWNENNGRGFIPKSDTRNKRSVWSIPTQAFGDAHFATFPPDLIEPCILAGCPADGTVLDPFGGAGTTGLVADRHGRSAILIELNPEYADMARRRIYNDAPLFADIA